MRSAVVMITIVALAGCTSPADGPPTSAAGDTRPSEVIPDDAPDIEGVVTEVDDDGRVLVEEDPAERSGSMKAWVAIVDDTDLVHRSGAAADRSDLVPGGRVSVWFSGPVAESYPVQGTADVIVVEVGVR